LKIGKSDNIISGEGMNIIKIKEMNQKWVHYSQAFISSSNCFKCISVWVSM
jgi:hypothetical protein